MTAGWLMYEHKVVIIDTAHGSSWAAHGNLGAIDGDERHPQRYTWHVVGCTESLGRIFVVLERELTYDEAAKLNVDGMELPESMRDHGDVPEVAP